MLRLWLEKYTQWSGKAFNQGFMFPFAMLSRESHTSIGLDDNSITTTPNAEYVTTWDGTLEDMELAK